MGNTFKKDPNKKRAEAAAATKALAARSDSDDRWSEVAPAEDPDLPPDIHQAFSQAWRIRAGGFNATMSRLEKEHLASTTSHPTFPSFLSEPPFLPANQSKTPRIPFPLEAIGSDAMTAEDVRGVFAKAFELGEWGYDKTVPLEEVRQNHQ